MSNKNERRRRGDRRLAGGMLPSGIIERRVDDRRQVAVTDISFFEWATHFASYYRGLSGSGAAQWKVARTVAATDEDGQR